jgi:cobalt-precorrin 5A hydrolase
MTERLSIGIGCSSRASAADILRLIAECIDPIPAGSILATLDRRAAMGEAVAARLGLPLVLLPASRLTLVPAVAARSSLALARTGTANVAEASALAALGPSARLLIEKRTGRYSTCAVAVTYAVAEACAVATSGEMTRP